MPYRFTRSLKRCCDRIETRHDESVGLNIHRHRLRRELHDDEILVAIDVDPLAMDSDRHGNARAIAIKIPLVPVRAFLDKIGEVSELPGFLVAIAERVRDKP